MGNRQKRTLIGGEGSEAEAEAEPEPEPGAEQCVASGESMSMAAPNPNLSPSSCEETIQSTRTRRETSFHWSSIICFSPCLPSSLFPCVVRHKNLALIFFFFPRCRRKYRED